MTISDISIARPTEPVLANLQKLPSMLSVLDASILYVPSLGRVAAGIPIEAVEDRNRDSLLALLTTPGRYALKVVGDSMIDAGIYDGDTIIVQSQQHANTGDIVIVLIDQETVTLKRFKSLPRGQIMLVADNPAYDNRCYDADRITIQGRVVGQIRQY
ncbi:MAG: repressor LexA [Gammaproteobacteria bacterium]|jgi:repressor LexA